MKYETPVNPNYVATIIKIKEVHELAGLDNLVSIKAFGYQALVSKDTKPGDIGVLFTAESQLSEEFARMNNLHRHSFDWERAIIELWDSRESQRSVIQINRTTLVASVKPARTQDIEAHTRNIPAQNARETGNSKIQKKLGSISATTGAVTPGTSGAEEPPKTPNSERSEDSQQGETRLQNTGSPSSNTISDTLNFAEIVSFVKDGGKFSSWITTTLPERFEGSSVRGVTWLSVGSEILYSVCSALSLTSKETRDFFTKHGRNNNEKEAGYLEDSRRVKAIKLRGWRSDALFMSLDAFKYLKLKPEDFAVGDVFDKIGDHEIVKKYVLKEPGTQSGPKARIRRVDVKAFPPHVDTVNFYRNEHQIPDEAQIIVTQKLHGSSGRWGRVAIERDLKWHEKLAQKFGVIVSTHKMATVAGSRMVVKSIDGEAEIGKQSFYSSDLWSEWAAKINDSIPEGFVVYGELVGYTSDGKEIQKGYTYDLMPGNSDLYIYRVAIISPQGRIVDLSWPEVRTFATSAGFKHVPEIATLRHDEFNPEVYMDSNFYNDWSDNELGSFVDVPVRLANPKHVDEGVVVRYDGPNGIFLTKAKSPIFLGFESAMLDEEAFDLEAEESSVES